MPSRGSFLSLRAQFTYGRELFREVYDTDPVRRIPMLFLTARAGHSSIGPNLHLDLIEANRRQLLDAGVKPRSIQVVGGCTSCSLICFSRTAPLGARRPHDERDRHPPA